MMFLVSPLLESYLKDASASNFYQDFDITWGDGRGQILNNGELLTLSLDKASGSGFKSQNEYLFWKDRYAAQACPRKLRRHGEQPII